MHIISYLISYFRRFETSRRGKPDINGVIRARWESILTTLEVIVSAIISGYILTTFTSYSADQFDSQALFHYWVMIDCIIMFLLPGYIYVSQFLQIQGDITKNLFSLSFLQSKVMRGDFLEKKNDINVQTKAKFHNLFADDKEDLEEDD